MKSFYEFWMMLEGYDYDSWLGKPYQDAEEDYRRRSNFSKFLGEGDEEAPFSLEVDVHDGDWESIGSIWVKDYVPNGSENPASEPVAYTAGQKDARGLISKTTGTEFMKPGKHLELLPAGIRAAAVAWVDKKVDEAIANYEPEDPRDYYDDRY